MEETTTLEQLVDELLALTDTAFRTRGIDEAVTLSMAVTCMAARLERFRLRIVDQVGTMAIDATELARDHAAALKLNENLTRRLDELSHHSDVLEDENVRLAERSIRQAAAQRKAEARIAELELQLVLERR